MAPDSIIVQFIGGLLLALLTGSWTPIPPDELPAHPPAPIVFAVTWEPRTADGGIRADRLVVLADGSTRPSSISALTSAGVPARSSD